MCGIWFGSTDPGTWVAQHAIVELRQPLLEAISIIFGRSFLYFLWLKGLEKIWKATPLLCACAVVIPWKRKMSKRHLASSNLTFWPITIDKTLYKRATSVAHSTNFSFEFFMKFSHKMPLYFFYTMVQKSQKWPKTQIKGSCLKAFFLSVLLWVLRTELDHMSDDQPLFLWDLQPLGIFSPRVIV